MSGESLSVHTVSVAHSSHVLLPEYWSPQGSLSENDLLCAAESFMSLCLTLPGFVSASDPAAQVAPA